MPSPLVLLRLLIAFQGFVLVLLLALPEQLPEPLNAYSEQQAADPGVALIAFGLLLVAGYLTGLAGIWFARRWGRILFSVALAAIPFFSLATGPEVLGSVAAFLETLGQLTDGALFALIWLAPPVACLFGRTPGPLPGTPAAYPSATRPSLP